MYVVEDKKHDYLVNECKLLLSKLPDDDEYTIKDMGIVIIINGGRVKIKGLHTEDIQIWNNERLEKLYSKLVMILQRVYELDAMN